MQIENINVEKFRVVGTVLNPSEDEKAAVGMAGNPNAEIIISGTFKLTPEVEGLEFREGVFLDPKNGDFILHNFRADTVAEMEARYAEIASQFEAA